MKGLFADDPYEIIAIIVALFNSCVLFLGLCLAFFVTSAAVLLLCGPLCLFVPVYIAVELVLLIIVGWIGLVVLGKIWAKPLQDRLQWIFTAILMFAFPVPLYFDMAPHFMLVWRAMTWGIGAACAIHAAKVSVQNSREMKKLAANAAPMTDIKVAPVANK
ncbi:hypothetical protein MP638_003715 [Amoeboaphelidium occidentale]|nr:hypothetical protein MP638_003715 [Amoeboaphelidium occidentale]